MIKNIFALVVGLSMLTSVSMSQESGLGGKLGLNLANVTGDVSNTSMRTSLHIGGYYNHMINDQFAIQPEFILWSGQGYKVDRKDSSGNSIDQVVKLNYLNIPIIGKYYFTEAISIHGGFQFGINLAASTEVDGKSVDLKDINTLDVAFAIGGGYELENGLNFSLRYNAGLTNINSTGDASANNSVIQISVGYRFTEELF